MANQREIKIIDQTEDLVLDGLIAYIFNSFSFYPETCKYLPIQPQKSLHSKPSKCQAKEDIRQALKQAGYKRRSPGNFDQVKDSLTAKQYHTKCIELIKDNLYRSVYCIKEEDEKKCGEDEISDESAFQACLTAKIPLIKIAKSKYLNISEFLSLATQTYNYDVEHLHCDDKARFFPS